VFERAAVAFNPFLPEVRANPYPHYRRLREIDPVHLSPRTGMWFLSRFEDCALVLRDPRFSAHLGQDRRRRPTALPRTMLNTDPPDHARLRRPASSAFQAQALDFLRPILVTAACALLDRASGYDGFDVVQEFAAPLATQALAALLAIPICDTVWFERTSRAAAANLDPLAQPTAARHGRAASDSLAEYFARTLEEQRYAQHDNLIGQLSACVAQGGITRDELISMLVLFVIGGHEPTVHLIGNSVLALVRHPSQLERLRAEPSPGYSVSQCGNESPQDRALSKAPEEVVAGRKGQQIVAPGQDKRLATAHEGTFSKTLLFEK
jgi:pimeloyl-[acyl-carrier protein] synthase